MGTRGGRVVGAGGLGRAANHWEPFMVSAGRSGAIGADLVGGRPGVGGEVVGGGAPAGRMGAAMGDHVTSNHTQMGPSAAGWRSHGTATKLTFPG